MLHRIGSLLRHPTNVRTLTQDGDAASSSVRWRRDRRPAKSFILGAFSVGVTASVFAATWLSGLPEGRAALLLVLGVYVCAGALARTAVGLADAVEADLQTDQPGEEPQSSTPQPTKNSLAEWGGALGLLALITAAIVVPLLIAAVIFGSDSLDDVSAASLWYWRGQ